MEKQNIRIKLRAYDNKILDASTEELLILLKEQEQLLKVQSPYQQELKDILF